jgi:hypothetical protein
MGGTTKFTCSHCNTTYIGSYTHVRKHLCGIMPCDEKKTIGVKTCDKVLMKDRKNTRGKRRKHKTNPKNQRLNLRPLAHIECSVVDPHPPMLVDSCHAFEV